LVAGALLLGMALASVVGVGVQVGSADVGAAPVPPRDALAAAETTGKALWGVFLVLLLGLASAVAGGITGVHRRARVVAVAVPPVPPERRVPLETT
jgi:hypothetical protein